MDLIFRSKKTIFLGLFPAVFVFVVFVVFPIIMSFYYGFFDWNGLSDPIFIGVQNYKEILSDPVFWLSFKNNVIILAFSVFGQLPIALGIAMLINKETRLARFLRVALFLPMMLSTVVVGLLWSMVLNSNIGILNQLLEFIHADFLIRDWLGDPEINIYTLGMVIVWQFFAFYMVIFLAALQNIPGEIMEAAELDGITSLKKVTSIILPLIWGTILSSVALCIAGSMRTFDLVYTMTQGGPYHASELMTTYMYNSSFSTYRYGYGSAVSLVIFVISFALIIASRKVLARKAD